MNAADIDLVIRRLHGMEMESIKIASMLHLRPSDRKAEATWAERFRGAIEILEDAKSRQSDAEKVNP